MFTRRLFRAFAPPVRSMATTTSPTSPNPNPSLVNANVNNVGPRERLLRTKLTETFTPTSLQIRNDSSKHRHHHAMHEIGGGDGETHFAIEIVSEAFTSKSTMQRHRLVYATLAELLSSGLHALQIKAKTPAEIEAADPTASLPLAPSAPS